MIRYISLGLFTISILFSACSKTTESPTNTHPTIKLPKTINVQNHDHSSELDSFAYDTKNRLTYFGRILVDSSNNNRSHKYQFTYNSEDTIPSGYVIVSTSTLFQSGNFTDTHIIIVNAQNKIAIDSSFYSAFKQCRHFSYSTESIITNTYSYNPFYNASIKSYGDSTFLDINDNIIQFSQGSYTYNYPSITPLNEGWVSQKYPTYSSIPHPLYGNSSSLSFLIDGGLVTRKLPLTEIDYTSPVVSYTYQYIIDTNGLVQKSIRTDNKNRSDTTTFSYY